MGDIHPVNRQREPLPRSVTTAATFTLDQLEQWTREFLADSGARDNSDDKLLMTSFICWVRQNKSNGDRSE